MEKGVVDWGFLDEKEAILFLEKIVRELKVVARQFNMPTVAEVLGDVSVEIAVQNEKQKANRRRSKQVKTEKLSDDLVCVD